jgi:hypothetical protein
LVQLLALAAWRKARKAMPEWCFSVAKSVTARDDASINKSDKRLNDDLYIVDN